MGSTDRAASIVTAPREIRHEIKAPIKGRGQRCHLIQHYLYSQEMFGDDEDDVFIVLVITGQT